MLIKKGVPVALENASDKLSAHIILMCKDMNFCIYAVDFQLKITKKRMFSTVPGQLCAL